MEMQIEEKVFRPMTEETANELAKAFEALGKATNALNEEIGKCRTSVSENIKANLEKAVAFYAKKVETSCFITRWWYKRKLQRAINAVLDFKIKEYLCE